MKIGQKLVIDAGNGYVGDMDCARVQKLIDEFGPIDKGRDRGRSGCDEVVNN